MNNESSVCLYCGSRNIQVSQKLPILYNQREFIWNRCKDCGLFFLSPALSPEDYSMLYSIDYHQKYYSDFDADHSAQVALVNNFTTKKSILDFGCGNGSMLAAFDEAGYTTAGVEFSNDMVNQLTQQYPSSKFITGDQFWNEATAVKYDIIHLGDVLEHLTNPLETVQKLKDKLSHDGIFFVEGPLESNLNLAFLFRQCTVQLKKIVNQEWVRIKEPYHVLYANYSNQKRFFEKSGLYPLLYKTNEKGWPYIESYKEIKTPWLFLQWLIVKASIGTSKLIPTWGNRFTYIGKIPRRVNPK